MGTAIGTKCASSYICIFMSEFETSFIKSQQNKPLVWFRYIDIFFIWTHREEKLKTYFKQNIYEMRSWFQKRANTNKVLGEELFKVRFSNQEKTCSKKGKGIPFIVTYHPILQAFNNIIKRKS